jgi:SAM-dependent methyltransferase
MLPLVEEWSRCPGCDGAALRALHVMRNGKPLVRSPFLAVLGCERCGLAFTSPRPAASALAAFYAKDTEEGWIRNELTEDSLKLARKRKTAAAKLAPVMNDGRGRRALDIGCGAGAMLDVLQQRGWETVGIEPGTLGEFAGRRHRMIETLPAEPTFDLVVLHHVLEHVLEPGGLLRDVHAACRPAAQLVVGVPSFDAVAVTGDFSYACSGVHINSFTAVAVANVLRVNGWMPTARGEGMERTRVVQYAERVDKPLDPAPEALAPAVRALREYGQRLNARGEFALCPLAWPDDV